MEKGQDSRYLDFFSLLVTLLLALMMKLELYTTYFSLSEPDATCISKDMES